MTFASFRKGRAISAANHAKISQAIGAIAGVLAAAGKIGDGQPGIDDDASEGANPTSPASAADGTGTRAAWVPDKAPPLRYNARRRR